MTTLIYALLNYLTNGQQSDCIAPIELHTSDKTVRHISTRQLLLRRFYDRHEATAVSGRRARREKEVSYGCDCDDRAEWESYNAMQNPNHGRPISAEFMAPVLRSPLLPPTPRGTFALGGTLAMILAFTMFSGAFAADASKTATAYHIPPQALGQALTRFSEISGNSLLADGMITSGRRSSPVNGTFTVEEALVALLKGTGLEPERLDAATYTLKRTREAAVRFEHAGAAADPGALAAVQTGILATLCLSPVTRPGDYDAVLHVSIDKDGRVEWVDEAQPSGNAERDAALRLALQGLKIDGPPGGRMQTVTVAIRSQPSRASSSCPP